MSEQRQDAEQVVNALEQFIRKLLPTQQIAVAFAPAELQVISYNGQKGTATLRKDSKIVDIQTHISQRLAAGDTVVGVPLSVASYYVVGRIA